LIRETIVELTLQVCGDGWQLVDAERKRWSK